MAEYSGHLFRFRDPNDPNKWIDIPILYQTMYAAYLAYCDEHDIAVTARLSEDAYYTTLGTLKSIADTLTGYGGTIPLSSGGTGFAAGELSDLLNYLGLVDSFDATSDTQFPSTAAVQQELTKATETFAKQLGETEDALRILIEKKLNADAFTMGALGISSGTANPNDKTPGTIYIKYS